MSRKAKVYYDGKPAGRLIEDEEGYQFTYDEAYLVNMDVQSVSLTLPLRTKPYRSKTMFPFFDGLIPEGWLLNLTAKIWKINPQDRMGLLLVCCQDCIGAVSVMEEQK